MSMLTRNQFAAILLVLCMSSVMAHAIEIYDAAALYRFEEEADTIAVGEFLTDASGNERHAEAFCGVIGLVAGQARFGQAGSFNQSSAFVDFEDVDTSGDFTFALWMKSATLGQAQVYLLSLSNGSGGGEQTAVIYQYVQNTVELYSGDSATDLRPGSQLSVPDMEWHHIVYTRSGSDYDAYLDGQKHDIATLDGQVHNPQYLSIGGTGHLRATGPVNLYEGLLDDVLVMTRGVDQAEVDFIMRGFVSEFAHAPSPKNEADDVLRLRDHVLSWEPGMYAAQHNVYLGTIFEDVNSATVPTAAGLDVNSLDLGRLEFGKTYFWRVDEVNAPPDNTIFRGDVWSFTVEPVGIPIPGESIAATASSSGIDQGPENTVNGSGLDVNDLDFHSTVLTDMWLTAAGEPAPAWIRYDFNKVYKLHEMLVWNYNGQSFLTVAGIKDVVVEYSSDGTNWMQIDSVNEFTRANGLDDYAPNTTVAFDGIPVMSVKIHASSNWSGGLTDQFGLSEVQFLQIPVNAREPSPDDGATEIAVDVTLGWRAGREAASHDVYVSADPNALTLAGPVTEPAFDTASLGLELGQDYYWRVDEVNDAETTTMWQGDIWKFTTVEFLVVDDFESYDSAENQIWYAWKDGLGYGSQDAPPYYAGNGTGSAVGNENTGSYTEETIVNSGAQSMPFAYDNTDGPSEATLTLDGQNWTTSGIKTLSIAFYDASDNTGELYVKINNAKIVYDGDPDNIAVNVWQTWNIDLTAVDGVQNVTSLSIGVDGADAAGMLYIDDIRLSPQAAVNAVYGDQLAISAYEWDSEGFLANTPATPDYWGSDLDGTKLTDGVIAADYSGGLCAGWNYNSSADAPFGPTLYFDLGSIQSIGGVAIYHQPRYYGFETVKVSVSTLDNPNRVDINDMADWTGEDIHWSDYWGIGDSGNAPSVMQAVPISQNGRWVRLQFRNWTLGYTTSWTIFSEFKFYSE